MAKLPETLRNVTDEFAPAFTKPTHARWGVLVAAAILTVGSRTILNVLRTVGRLAPGHASSYHRVLSRARFWRWRAAKILARLVLEAFCPDGAIYLAGDDTVDEHPGDRVYGKGCHRDAVRSSQTFTAWRWGHKWVVLAILVSVPWSARRWALPVLVALYQPKKENQKAGRRHKTPATLMRLMLAVLIRWFPGRKFVFSGDGGFATHELARFAQRRRARLTIVSRFYPDANLFAAPPQPRGKKNGRPRVKGRKLASPAAVVKRTKQRTRLTVAWYGGGERRVAIVTGTAHWYQSGAGLVAVRWVFVHDLTGTHRDDYFFTTEVGLSPKQIIETFTGRWSIETMFQEMRAYVGLETTRGRTRSTVLRAAPMLFGLYTLIVLLYARLPARWKQAPAIEWRGKTTVTFSDVITRVRRWLWAEWVLETACPGVLFSKLPPRFRTTVLQALATAA